MSRATIVMGRATPIDPPLPASARLETAAGVTSTKDPPVTVPPISVALRKFDPAVFSVTVKLWTPASALVKV